MQSLNLKSIYNLLVTGGSFLRWLLNNSLFQIGCDNFLDAFQNILLALLHSYHLRMKISYKLQLVNNCNTGYFKIIFTVMIFKCLWWIAIPFCFLFFSLFSVSDNIFDDNELFDTGGVTNVGAEDDDDDVLRQLEEMLAS